MRRRERVLSCLAIVASFVGGMGLLLLSIFDTKRHPSLHRVFLLVFIVGVGFSAIFTIAEVNSPSYTLTERCRLSRFLSTAGSAKTSLSFASSKQPTS